MSALPEVVPFSLPKKPRVKEKDAPPDQRKICVLPIKAVFDQKLTHGALQVLAALCAYCNRAGITWVSQTRLAKELGISQQAVAKQFKQLREAGYVETVRKGFRGERTDTLRVVFDASIDVETAMAVTSSIEDTRPPVIKKEQAMQAEQPDRAGQAKIASMITKVLRQPTKEQPAMTIKKEDSMTVKKMKEDITKAKGRRTKAVDKPVDQEAANHNPQVVNEEALHLQPNHNLEVVTNTENTVLRGYKEDSLKRFNTVLNNQQKAELIEAGLTEQQMIDNLQVLSDAYASEGLKLNQDRLVAELIELAAVSRGIA